MEKIRTLLDLQVYQFARAAAIKVSAVVNILPADERFDMAQQWRRSARGVCSNHEVVLGQLLTMVKHAHQWTIGQSPRLPPVSQTPSPRVPR